MTYEQCDARVQGNRRCFCRARYWYQVVAGQVSYLCGIHARRLRGSTHLASLEQVG